MVKILTFLFPWKAARLSNLLMPWQNILGIPQNLTVSRNLWGLYLGVMLQIVGPGQFHVDGFVGLGHYCWISLCKGGKSPWVFNFSIFIRGASRCIRDDYGLRYIAATMVLLCSVARWGESRGVSERVHRGLLFTLSGGFACKGIIRR